MRHYKKMQRTAQEGFSLLELAIVLVVVALMVIYLVQYQISAAQQVTYQQIARQTRAVADAGLRYTIANNDSLKLITGPTTPAVVTMATLIAGDYLPAGAALNNSFGQTYQLTIIQDAAGNLLPIVVSTGGNPLDGGGVRDTARMITQDGGSGGFIAAAANDTPGPTVAVGASGWQVTLASYGVNPGVGHVVDAIFFNQQSAQTNVDTALHRTATPGQPQYNQMSTAIDMQNNNIVNGGTITANGNIGAAGKSATTGLPAGWSGGVHSWDIYGEGTFGMGTAGALGASISNTGEFLSNGGWYRSTGATGWYSQTYGGGVYMQDANWVRIYNNKGLYTAGQVQAGTVVSNGRLDAQEYAQIDGTAIIGNSCTPNGLLAQASSGSGMVQCKAGVWVLLQGLVNSVQVVSTGSSCGWETDVADWFDAYATCPAGYKIMGGGYQNTSYAPVGTNNGGAPQNNQPYGNGWWVFAGSMTGNTCFAAYAVCGQ